MPNKVSTLADKLSNEGDRTVTFFRALPEIAWQQSLYHDGACWDVRGTFEHLIVSEELLLLLFERIVLTGLGYDSDMTVDDLNRSHTGDLASVGIANLLDRYLVTRAQTVSFTRALSETHLTIRARHPALGDSTLEEMLKLIAIHHSMHMRDVKRALARG